MVETPLVASQAGPGADGSTQRPRRRSWKVLVLGNSVPTTVERGSRHDATYGEVLEWLLADSGHQVRVRNAGRWFDQIDSGNRRFMEQERTEFPDVLILQYGSVECRPNVVPKAVLKHFARLRFHTWDEGIGRVARAYRRLMAPHLWRLVRRYQQVASARVGLRTWRMSPDRFARELRRLIAFARHERMLVLVADANPPGPTMVHFMPALTDRWALYQRVLADVVAGFDDSEVRLVALSKVVEELGEEAGLPDGLHFTALGHRRAAEMLALEIAPWLDAQDRQG